MPKLSWPDMIRVFPDGHLVVGYLPMGTKAVRPSRIVRRLIERQRPRGSWAVSARQEVRGPAVYCLFESKQDADRFGKVVQARHEPITRGASERWFALDGPMAHAIEQILKARGEPERPSRR